MRFVAYRTVLVRRRFVRTRNMFVGVAARGGRTNLYFERKIEDILKIVISRLTATFTRYPSNFTAVKSKAIKSVFLLLV